MPPRATSHHPADTPGNQHNVAEQYMGTKAYSFVYAYN